MKVQCMQYLHHIELQHLLNLGCLHPVACVRSGDGGFLYSSTQRHYRSKINLC
jgi:hypothetical protein